MREVLELPYVKWIRLSSVASGLSHPYGAGEALLYMRVESPAQRGDPKAGAALVRASSTCYTASSVCSTLRRRLRRKMRACASMLSMTSPVGRLRARVQTIEEVVLF